MIINIIKIIICFKSAFIIFLKNIKSYKNSFVLFIKFYLFGIMLKKCGVFMIIYQNTKGGFIDDIRNDYIADKIEAEFAKHNIALNIPMF